MTKYEIKLRRQRGRTRRLNELGLNWRGEPLKNRKWRHKSLIGLHGRERHIAREMLRNGEKMRAHIEAGLTVRGTVRITRRWPKFKSRSERFYAYRKDYRAQLYARGLTSRGTPRLAAILTDKEQAWRQLRASMQIHIPEVLPMLEREEAA